MPRFNLSPSLIGWFFYHDCERYLRYHATPEQERERSGIPVVAMDQSPTTRALLDAGSRWEEEVVRTKLAGRVRLPDGIGPLSDRSVSIEESFEVLPRLSPGEAIYQSTIPVSVHFLRNYGLDPEVHRFSPCRPDLVMLGEGSGREAQLSVIDIKASEDLSVSHRIQATLYAMILDHALDLLGIDRPVDMDRAGIWLYGEDEPEPVDLHLNIRVLEDFFRHRLRGILACPLEDVPWHITSRCESCEFYPHCREEAETSASVSQIPGLSPAGRRYLREAPWNPGHSINTLSDLTRFLEIPESDEYLNNCGSLAGQGDRLRATVRALQTGEVIRNAGRSLALPIYEDIGIVLTLQKDPVSDRIYALGLRRFKGEAVYGTPSHEAVYVAENPDDCAGCDASLSGRSPPNLRPSTTTTRAGTGRARNRSRPTSTIPTKRTSSSGCSRRRLKTPRLRRTPYGCGSTTRTPASPRGPATRQRRSRSRSSFLPGRYADCWHSPSPLPSACPRSWRPSPLPGLRIS